VFDQTYRFVDRNVRLALRVRIDRLKLVALDAALLDEIIEHDLGAERVQLGAAARERAAIVVDHADLDLLCVLRVHGHRDARHHRNAGHPGHEAGKPTHAHDTLPARLLVFFCPANDLRSAYRSGSRYPRGAFSLCPA
jgi:hypothetical protein